jgi:DNA-binding NtrC family response regulator
MLVSTHGAHEAPVLVGASPAMLALRADIEAAARTHAKVLVLGETGVGKEVVARLIHQDGSRRNRPFVAVNCCGIPETLLESELFGHKRGSFTGAYRDKLGMVKQADGGTLFLDELGEMSLRMQAMLLRFAEGGEIQPVGADGPTGRTDVRLITATNRDLRQRIADGAFREDLYYRLNVIRIEIPPLRARGGDILLLTQHYLQRAAAAHRLPVPQLTADAVQTLSAYAWPGNVRELRNVTERLVLHASQGPLTSDDLPVEVQGSATPRVSVHGGRSADRVAALEIESVASAVVDRAWERLGAGEDFWVVVGHAFKSRAMTRSDLKAIVDRGLHETRGSYRALLPLFHLPREDYKRFHAFLYQQKCNLPVASYREQLGRRRPAMVTMVRETRASSAA